MSVAKTTLRRRWRLAIAGTVQGVGFRPFIYRLAGRFGLAGWVLNNTDGVLLEVEGREKSLARFVAAINDETPPLARIAEIKREEIPLQGERTFQIHLSEGASQVRAGIPPDVATCPACLADITDAGNRRYRYPFTNCTHCGPRFTIITAVPYDRPHTTMRAFTMCPACRAEYEDPADRRFHAQPNACPICGPHVRLDAIDYPVDAAAISATVNLLRVGKIVAIKGLGGYHFACDARNGSAVRALRERKGRADKPFAVMVPDLATARGLCRIDAASAGMLCAYERPIVLLPARPANVIADAVAPGIDTLGLLLPYTPLHQLLLAEFGGPLVMTSANLSDEPLAFRDDDARARLGRIADHFLSHNRPIHMACDDSVVRPFAGTPLLIRRARGYVPIPFDLNVETDLPSILACGGDLKNTFCLTKGRTALVSQHLGDLENAATWEHYRQAVQHFCDFYAVQPLAIAHDLHPDYHSTRYALAISDVPHISVQHHHAHIAACMAEHRLQGQVIGVAYDGAGFGADSTIWGGEILIADYRDFRRAGHLKPFALPGGEAAVRKPARIALGLLLQLSLSPDEALSLLPGLSTSEGQMVSQQISRGLNVPLTSSLGRLFDAVSALLDICREVTYEGQAAIQLEIASNQSSRGVYPYQIARDNNGAWEMDIRPLFAALLAGRRAGEPCGLLAGRFHRTVAKMTAEVCTRLRDEFALNRVALSGGVWQNLLLRKLALAELTRHGFEVFLPAQFPCNDGGLSLGQALVAAARMDAGLSVGSVR